MANAKRIKQERSTEDYLGAVRRMLKAAARRVARGDEFELGELLSLQSDLDWAIGQAVAGQRELGAKTWAMIADGASITKQTAHGRWADVAYELE